MSFTLIKPYITLLKKNPQYRRLWLSQVISLTGDWFNYIATITLVMSVSHSGLAIGGLAVARLLPPLVLGPLVGVIADRFDRRKIMIASDLLRMVVVLGFLLVRSASDFWLLYSLLLLQLSISAFYTPALASLMPSLVEEKDLLTANALDGMTWSSMLAIGAALGGAATALFGTTTAFLIDAGSFALAAWFVFRIAVPADQAVQAATQNGWLDFLGGLSFLRQHPHILALTLVKGAGALAYGAMAIAEASFAATIFPIGDDGSATLGLISMTIGLGSGLGPIIVNRFTSNNPIALRWSIGLSFVLAAIGYLIIAWSPTLPVLLLGMLIRTSGGGLGWVYASALLQMTVPARYRGRVFAFDFAIYTLANIGSVFWGSLATDTLQFNAYEIALASSLVSLTTLIAWVIYHQNYVKNVVPQPAAPS